MWSGPAWSCRTQAAESTGSPGDRLLTAFSAERVANLPADDWRAAHHDFTTGLTANLRIADALGPITARHGTTVAEVAIAWTLAWPGVRGAIVGARRPHQVDGWMGAGSHLFV